jgi:hypothetical protein
MLYLVFTYDTNWDEWLHAYFNPVVSYPLSVSLDGTGSGTVTSNPAGIDCGSDCSENYASGTLVTLSAAADPGSTFTGWSGEGCSGTGTCVVTMDAPRSVTATFTATTFLLTVVLAGDGPGFGTVTSDPAGIDCGSDCTESYAPDTLVTLTASVAPNFGIFIGWSGGGCSGTDPCTVTMDSVKTVTAAFNTIWYTLIVNKAGSGTGTVTSDPAGIDCGSDCTENHLYNVMVTLTAVADAGSVFAGWSGGGCSGTEPCTVTMDISKTVTATFNATSFPLNVFRAGNGAALGTVTSDPAGIDCGAD